jgi:hypothetical protein
MISTSATGAASTTEESAEAPDAHVTNHATIADAAAIADVEDFGGADGARTRDLLRDRQAF